MLVGYRQWPGRSPVILSAAARTIRGPGSGFSPPAKPRRAVGRQTTPRHPGIDNQTTRCYASRRPITTLYVREAPTIISIVHNRDLVIIGIAESVSGVGNWITQVAVFAVIIFHGGGGPAEASAIWLAGLTPMLIVSPLAGRLVDRFDRKWLMIVSEAACGFTVLAIVFTTRLDLIYALLALQAVFGTLLSPARQAVIPDLARPEALPRANAFLQQLSGTVKIGAPLLAGLLLTVLEPRQAMILDVISYALSVAILTRLPSLPARRKPRALTDASSYPAPAVRPGGLLGVLRACPGLRLLFALQFFSVLNIMGFDILYPVFTRDVLQGGASFFGACVGLIGLGTVAATMGLLALKGERSPWNDVVAALMLLGCIPASLTLATSFSDLGLARIIVALGCLLGGVGNGLLHVQVATLLQRLSPRELLGRVAGGFQSIAATGQLLALLAVPLVVPSLLSLGVYFGVTTALVLALTLGTALFVKGHRAQRAPTSPVRIHSSVIEKL
ncbi:MAG: MFS transporter [Chloroflexota bacterium]